MKQSLNTSGVQPGEPSYDRRAAKRLFLNFVIEISGIGQNGHPFVEQTRTNNISDEGCRLRTNIHLESGDLINIKLIVPNKREQMEEKAQPFEVVWVSPEETGWSVGARKISPEKIWKVSFPPRPSRY